MLQFIEDPREGPRVPVPMLQKDSTCKCTIGFFLWNEYNFFQAHNVPMNWKLILAFLDCETWNKLRSVTAKKILVVWYE